MDCFPLLFYVEFMYAYTCLLRDRAQGFWFWFVLFPFLVDSAIACALFQGIMKDDTMATPFLTSPSPLSFALVCR